MEEKGSGGPGPTTHGVLEDRKALALHSSLEPAGVCPLTRVADEPAGAALAASPYDTRRRSIGGGRSRVAIARHAPRAYRNETCFV